VINSKNKKILILLAVLAWLSASCIIVDTTHAFGIRIGPYVWFAWWFPSFQDWMLKSSIIDKQLPRLRKDFYFNPSLLYGPVLTIDFNNRVNLSSVFVTGNYRLRATVVESLYNSAFITSHPDIGIYKYDLDSTLNIVLDNNIKLFLGLKYQNYNYSKVDLIQINPMDVSLFGRDTVHFNGLSGGIGFGLNFKLNQNLFIYWNLSALYQKPIIRLRQNRYLIIPPNVVHFPKKIIPVYDAMGGNLSISIAYRIDPISTTLSLGFRYQFIYTFGKDRKGFDLNNKWDHFDGITLAAVYSYQLLNKEKSE
jgi:hypothetical protein